MMYLYYGHVMDAASIAEAEAGRCVDDFWFDGENEETPANITYCENLANKVFDTVCALLNNGQWGCVSGVEPLPKSYYNEGENTICLLGANATSEQIERWKKWCEKEKENS